MAQDSVPEKPDWGRTDRAPSIGSEAVHIWRISLVATSGFGVEDLRAVLSADERLRSERYLDPSAGMRYAIARATMRRILGLYLSTPPEALEFTYGAQGKPRVAVPATGLEFNLSHAGSLALLAVAWERPVGIDLEPLRPGRNLQAIARRVFRRDEANRLETLQGQGQHLAFFRYWTAMEARAKADGGGVFRSSRENGAGDWHRWHFIPADGYIAAAAVSRSPNTPETCLYLALAETNPPTP